MQTFSKLLVSITLASAVLAAPNPALDISIRLNDHDVSGRRDSHRGRVGPKGGSAVINFDEIRFPRYLKPENVSGLRWEGPWMMFNGDTVNLPGVVSKPNAVFVDTLASDEPAWFGVIEHKSPGPWFRIDSLCVSPLMRPLIPINLVLTISGDNPSGERDSVTLKKESADTSPVCFDMPRYRPLILVNATPTLTFGPLEDLDGEPRGMPFSMDDLKITWWGLFDDQHQHDQLKA